MITVTIMEQRCVSLGKQCLPLTGVSRDGRKITTTRKHLTISFGARRNQYKTDKIAFFNFKNIHFSSNKRLLNASTRCLNTFCGSSLRNRPVSHSTDCQPCYLEAMTIKPYLHQNEEGYRFISCCIFFVC